MKMKKKSGRELPSKQGDVGTCARLLTIDLRPSNTMEKGRKLFSMSL